MTAATNWDGTPWTWHDGYAHGSRGWPPQNSSTDQSSDYRRGYDTGVAYRTMPDFCPTDAELAAGIAARRARLRNERNNRHLKGEAA